jgi:hypothetical protein
MDFGWFELLCVGIGFGLGAVKWTYLPRGKDLREYLAKPKSITVHGIRFKIIKVNPLNFMEGANAIQQLFQSYEQKKDSPNPVNSKKIKDHYVDVICASVVEPKLVRKQEDSKDGAIWVDNLFTDWDLVNELYEKITFHSYGKKKLR